MRAFASVFKDSASARMMDVLFENWGAELSKSNLARAAGISRDSVYRILPDWERLGIVNMTRQDGVKKLYSLNKENEAVLALKNFKSAIRPEQDTLERAGSTRESAKKKEGIAETLHDRLRTIKMRTEKLLSAVSEPEDENAAQLAALLEKGAISRRTYDELLRNLKK